MQDEDLVVNGMGIWLQNTFDIKYRFYHCTSVCRFYNCKHISNQMYYILTASLLHAIIQKTSFMSADQGCDVHKIYYLSTEM